MNNYECRIWTERGSELEYAEIGENKVYLTGWNGESWTECWTERSERTDDGGWKHIQSENFECWPLYAYERDGLEFLDEVDEDYNDLIVAVGLKTWKDLENT